MSVKTITNVRIGCFLAKSRPKYIFTHYSDIKGYPNTVWDISKTQVDYREVIWPRFGQKTSKNHAFLRSKDILKFHKFINFPWFQHLWPLTLLSWPKKCFVLWKTFSWPTNHQRFQFCPPLCHKMCFGQVLARVLRCNIVKFCQLIRYSSYSGVRTRTRFFVLAEWSKTYKKAFFWVKTCLGRCARASLT